MLKKLDRNLKLLGVIWLLLATIAFVRGFYVVAERGDDWVDIAIFRLLFGAIHIAIVLLIAHRYRIAPRLLAVASGLFLIMYLLGATSGRPHAYMDIAPFVAMVVSLSLTYSPRGRAALRRHMSSTPEVDAPRQ